MPYVCLHAKRISDKHDQFSHPGCLQYVQTYACRVYHHNATADAWCEDYLKVRIPHVTNLKMSILQINNQFDFIGTILTLNLVQMSSAILVVNVVIQQSRVANTILIIGRTSWTSQNTTYLSIEAASSSAQWFRP